MKISAHMQGFITQVDLNNQILFFKKKKKGDMKWGKEINLALPKTEE